MFITSNPCLAVFSCKAAYHMFINKESMTILHQEKVANGPKSDFTEHKKCTIEEHDLDFQLLRLLIH